MKRIITSASKYPVHIRITDIVEYLNDLKCDGCTLTGGEIKKMAKEIGACLHDEEAMSGEPYESIYDADVEELCDASTTDLHDMYYNLIFGPFADDM